MAADAGKPSSRGTETPGRAGVKTINLALQGGGAHGAFTGASSTACSRMSAHCL